MGMCLCSDLLVGWLSTDLTLEISSNLRQALDELADDVPAEAVVVGVVVGVLEEVLQLRHHSRRRKVPPLRLVHELKTP